MPTPLALQLYTVRTTMAEDRGAALARAAEAGFKAVEPYGIGSPDKEAAARVADAKTFRAQLDANGLTAVATHGFVASDASADAIFDELGELGVDRLIAPVPALAVGVEQDAIKSADGVRRLAEALNAGAERAAERGVRVGYHNHDFEWGAIDGGAAYDVLVSHLSPRVFLEVDLYWAHAGGQTPADVVSRYADRVQLVHVKDGPGVRDELQTAIGTGVVDNLAAVRAGAHVAYHVVELDDCAGDPFEVAAAGGRWLVEQGVSQWELDQ